MNKKIMKNLWHGKALMALVLGFSLIVSCLVSCGLKTKDEYDIYYLNEALTIAGNEKILGWTFVTESNDTVKTIVVLKNSRAHHESYETCYYDLRKADKK